eukprot:451318_1
MNLNSACLEIEGLLNRFNAPINYLLSIDTDSDWSDGDTYDSDDNCVLVSAESSWSTHSNSTDDEDPLIMRDLSSKHSSMWLIKSMKKQHRHKENLLLNGFLSILSCYLHL